MRISLRSLRKTPGFTIAVLLTLALGIGANTAIFTVVNAVLLHPLPYPDSDRLVNIARKGTRSSTAPMFEFWRQNNPGFEDLAAYQGGINLNLTGIDKPEPVQATKASLNYFRLLGAHPILGRVFSAQEDQFGGPRVMLLSYGLWQRRFAGDASVIGKAFSLSGAPYVVIGVVSPGFQPYPPTEVWIPLQADPDSVDQAHVLTVLGRLGRSVTLAQANSWMKVLGLRYLQSHPQQLGNDEKNEVTNMQEELTGEIRSPLLLLLGAVGLVLLIATANVANLLLARAAGRRKEIAVRVALGAGRWRIARQLLTESLLLALAGGALGLLLGAWGVRALIALTPSDLPRLPELSSLPTLDPRVAGFAFLLALITGALFGLLPALRASRIELSGGRASHGHKHNRTQSLLVISEIAISLVLLCGAVLLIRSFAAMHSVTLGFDPSQVLTMEVSLSGASFAHSAEVDRLARQFVERAQRISGVESAALANSVPLRGQQDFIFDIPGRQPLAGFKFTADVQWRIVSPRYFGVLRIPLLSGRLLRENEPGKTVVINQTTANKYWPNTNPIGQTIWMGRGLGPAIETGLTEIVGVVGDVREDLSFNPPPTIYQTPLQVPDAAMAIVTGLKAGAILVRTHPGVDPLSVARPVEQALLAAANLPAARIQTMAQVSRDSTARQSFNLVLLGLFATMALLLAAVGIYGVMSYGVEQRTHEIGIRSALGALRRDTVALVLRQALGMAMAGVAAGIAASFALTRLLSAQLFGVKPVDPLTFTLAPLLLITVAIFAACAPALRASRVDPLVALRHD